MTDPIVAIVGRPNVGKSTLFNHLAGQRLSIVHDTPGITRDRIVAKSQWRGRSFSIIDTSGLETRTEDDLAQAMREQVQIAIDMADVIIFLVDLKAGMTAEDQDIAVLLRKTEKPVILAVNKADQVGPLPLEAYEFYQLGFDVLLTISSAHRLGVGDLLDAVFEAFPEQAADADSPERIAVAVIGKPNVGKSSLVNALLGENRLIVSSQPGTTRDAIDSPINTDDGSFTLIDTAGLRKKSRIDSSVEHYSMIRSLAAIERSDVCLILIDATEGTTEQDTKIAGYAHNQGKASIFVVNKWDLRGSHQITQDEVEQDIRTTFSFMPYAPIVTVSATNRLRVDRLLPLVRTVYEEAGKRLSTGLLNDVLNEAVAMSPPPQDKGKRLKLYYGTQVGVHPPQVALFINQKDLMHFSYERYLENQLRRAFGFDGTPIWFLLRPKESRR